MKNSSDDDDDDYDNHSNNDYDSEIKFRNGKPTEDRLCSEKNNMLFSLPSFLVKNVEGRSGFSLCFLKISIIVSMLLFFFCSVPQQAKI